MGFGYNGDDSRRSGGRRSIGATTVRLMIEFPKSTGNLVDFLKQDMI